MINSEIQQFNEELTALTEHLVSKQNDNFALNYAIDANFRRLKPVLESMQKSVNKELIEIEQKAIEIERKKLEKKNKGAEKPEIDERTIPEITLAGLAKLPQEDQDKHAELMKEYHKFMAEENTEFQVYKIKREKIESIRIELPYMSILNKILYED